ncbi:MAG: glycosyltransferase family 9 protein [Candidatus Marinimicrobia bacterium]|nr:glycosyltransferase family 9 protein [Candidatus Neomarinimicrobiota bacterium]
MAVHLAAALQTPALAIFGSQDPALTRPYGKYGYVIKAAGTCTHKRKDWRLCPECMASVRPTDVMKKVKSILGERRGEDS